MNIRRVGDHRFVLHGGGLHLREAAPYLPQVDTSCSDVLHKMAKFFLGVIKPLLSCLFSQNFISPARPCLQHADEDEPETVKTRVIRVIMMSDVDG